MTPWFERRYIFQGPSFWYLYMLDFGFLTVPNEVIQAVTFSSPSLEVTKIL